MKKLLFSSLLLMLVTVACDNREHGNPPAGDIQRSSEPKDFDTTTTGKDTMLLPH